MYVRFSPLFDDLASSDNARIGGRVDVAWSNAVGANTSRANLERDALHHADNAVFGGI
jgi:hypothetical protein